MIISARFGGICRTCNRAFKAGDRIGWARGQHPRHALCTEEGQELQAAIAPSKALSSDLEIPVPAGLSYLPFQNAGIGFMLEKGSAICADEMGVGKTIQAVGVINARPTLARVLVICPSSVKLNWRNELKKWLVRPALIQVWPLKTRRAPAKPEELGLIVDVINFDQLGKLPPDASWDLMIIDEAHACKNPKSARTKRVFALRARCSNVLCLTGTPILNRPVELFPLLQLVAPEIWDPAGLKGQELVGPGKGGGFFKYAKRYCNAQKKYFGRKSFWDFDGASNLDELQDRLRATCMVRRLKKDVLAELPPKRRQTITLASEGAEKLLAEELKFFGDDSEDLTTGKAKIAFANISRVRQELALKKVEAAIAHITDALESSEKIVVFAHHKEVVSALLRGLEDFSPVCIVGETSGEERQAAVERFQTDKECRVIVGSIGAMGVGLTLTAASHVVFVELDWTPAMLTQCEDRCHRISQRESVLIQRLVYEGSLDARMVELLTLKQEIAELALDADTLDDSADPIALRPVHVPAVQPEVAPEVVANVHSQLRYLAGMCDGANAKDGSGFDRIDSAIGKQLAARAVLSPRQALLGQKILVKYARQLASM